MYEFLALLKAENPEAYKKLAEQGIMIGHPVTIKGQNTRPDNGIGYHTTIKFFDPNKDTTTGVHDVARGLKFTPPDPEQTQIEPSMFQDRLGNDVYVLKLHGPHADQIKEHHSKFSHMGFPAAYQFAPHISVDKATWQHIVDSGAKTAHEAGIEFGHAQLKQGHKVLTTYRHGNIQTAPMEDKLAASEKMTIAPLDKSNYGPAGAGLYNPADNARRKMGRTSDTVEGAGPNRAVKATTPSFRQQAEKEAREARAKSKSSPVKVFSRKEMVAYARKTKQKVAPLAKDELAPLEKGVKQMATAAAMAGLIGVASPTKEAVPAMHSQQQYDSSKMLQTIASVESSGGKFMHHRQLNGPINGGESAFGKYALTPSVIRETVRMNPELKQKYGKIASLEGQDLHHFMQDNPGLEDRVAQRHLARLEHHFGKDPSKIGYAWLNGISGTYKATREKEDIENHWHVKKIKDAYRGN